MSNGQEFPPQHDHPLFPVLVDAITQAMFGKGERHGGATTPFMEQPWLHYSKLHGRGFLTGQAAKKLEEAASTKDGEAFIQECRGAIVYIGMAILREQMDRDGFTFNRIPEVSRKISDLPSRSDVKQAQEDLNRWTSDTLDAAIRDAITTGRGYAVVGPKLDDELLIEIKTYDHHDKVKLRKRQLDAMRLIVENPDWLFEIKPKPHDWQYLGFNNSVQAHQYKCLDCGEIDNRSRQQEHPEGCSNICYSLGDSK